MIAKKISKRPILLLEVLIAFALVVLCVFPLLAPHVSILKAQYQFNHKIALDQAVNKLYAHLLEKVYRGDVHWESIVRKEFFPIDADLLKSIGIKADFPFRGSYRFSIARSKGKEEQPMSANIISLEMVFEPKGAGSKQTEKERKEKMVKYEYEFFAARLHDVQERDNSENKP
jgi:hypothetical protein